MTYFGSVSFVSFSGRPVIAVTSFTVPPWARTLTVSRPDSFPSFPRPESAKYTVRAPLPLSLPTGTAVPSSAASSTSSCGTSAPTDTLRYWNSSMSNDLLWLAAVLIVPSSMSRYHAATVSAVPNFTPASEYSREADSAFAWLTSSAAFLL